MYDLCVTYVSPNVSPNVLPIYHLGTTYAPSVCISYLSLMYQLMFHLSTIYLSPIYHLMYYLYTTFIPPIYHLYTTYAPPMHHLCTTYTPPMHHICTTFCTPKNCHCYFISLICTFWSFRIFYEAYILLICQ